MQQLCAATATWLKPHHFHVPDTRYSYQVCVEGTNRSIFFDLKLQ